jgi:hypothetical protein
MRVGGWLWMLGLALAPSVGAEEPEEAEAALVVARFEDIEPMLPPAGARQWDPGPLVEAIARSSFTFTPKHYYELLDKRVHVDVVKIVASRSGVFYDPAALPLDEIQARSRRGQTSAQVALGSSNFVEMFEFFNDRKNELDAAEARIGPSKPKGSNESDSVFEKRERVRLERLAHARGPTEGRIEATTFQVDLPAAVVDRDGCRRSVAQVDMTDIPLELFRTTAGTTATNAPIAVSGASLESARFTLETPKRFEALGRCGTTGTRLRLTMQRTWDGKWTGQGGF